MDPSHSQHKTKRKPNKRQRQSCCCVPHSAYMMKTKVTRSIVVACLYSTVVAARSLWFPPKFFGSLPPTTTLLPSSSSSRQTGEEPLDRLRGGGDTTTTSSDRTSSEEEEERYSRQVYAVGKRAHGLIRSSVIYLDGPVGSGLLYETAKNLALSGIRKLVLIVDDGNEDESKFDSDSLYHNQALDDLGNAYLRAARAELEHDETARAADILAAYIQRLNPFVQVSIVTDRKESLTKDDSSGRKVVIVLDRPYSTQVQLNRLARANGVSFVALETAGVFGRIFCDFGPSFEVHDTDGETPLVTPLLRVERLADIDQHEKGDNRWVAIHCMDGEKHDVSKGDVIRFQFRNGDYSASICEVVKVKTPFQFVARLREGDTAGALLDQLNDAVSFSRTKIPQTINFIGLEDATKLAATDGTMFTACDLDKSWDEDRRKASFGCFQALASFVEEHQRLPGAKDRKTFSALVSEACDEDINKPKKGHIKNFLSSCAAKFGPLQAVFGAIGAQEALKAATGLYSPVKQFLLYDCDEVLGAKSERSEESTDDGYDTGLRHILGDSTVEKMQSQRIFIVGAGAIGCEILKNLAAMGAGTKNKGKIILTDMDTIEKSNLSRQFLFRDSDIGKFKSLAAMESVLRFQPSTKIEAHAAKVGATGDNLFDGKFWTKKVDTVLNALDNMDARIFIDRQCVANQKSLVDAGTLGPKGNVQVVIPFQSESYSSSVDPPEQAIPVCTLKNFPYAISHTIQWGRDLFDGFFRSRPSEATKFISSLQESSLDEIVSLAVGSMGEEAALAWSDDLENDLHPPIEPNSVLELALNWATRMAWKLFYKSINELLEEHPLDSRDDDGELFWSGSRRPPSPLKYVSFPTNTEEEVANANLVDFVQNAARLRLECYKSVADKGVAITHDDAKRALSQFDFEAQHDDGSNGNKNSNGNVNVNVNINQRVTQKLSHLSALSSFPEMSSAEFEKDDDTNGHVAFVNAASNLRAICYGIPPVDAMETRRIAGNIIPAMISTTAVVSAISCIEMVKLVQEAPLKKHRNAFINLALPFFAFTVPLPAEPVQGLHGREYTLWDRLAVKESKKTADGGGLTIKSLLTKLKRLASDDPSSVDVSSISLGPYLLYASFLHEDDRSLLKSSVWDVIAEALEDPDEGAREEDRQDDYIYSADDKSFDLTVVVEDSESGEEAELPTVCLKRYIGK
eukprot:scaffold4707_cov164-Amphora_coffeaeformis.AAC.15